jgi:adenosine deaminase
VATELGAERIDHGMSLIEDPDLVRLFADRRIPLTMCPTSNVVIANAFTFVAQHPLPALRAAGVLVTVNTDDPALTDLDLAREYDTCARAWNWSWDQMTDLALDGVTATWLDDADKRDLPARVREASDRLRPQVHRSGLGDRTGQPGADHRSGRGEGRRRPRRSRRHHQQSFRADR